MASLRNFDQSTSSSMLAETVISTSFKSVLIIFLSGGQLSDESITSPDEQSPHCTYDLVGDNCDVTVKPTYMSSEKQNKSLHWFLNLGVIKRVTDPELPDLAPRQDIKQVENGEFIPNVEDCVSLDENFCFHIAHILVKAVPFLVDFKIPDVIDHPFLEEMKKKSTFYVLDLLEKNENKSDEIIDILHWIHQNFVPCTEEDHPEALERIVFGGDVLTNERAYSGQMAMMNGRTSYERMGSVIHRPEGLHRLMNLTQVSFIIHTNLSH